MTATNAMIPFFTSHLPRAVMTYLAFGFISLCLSRYVRYRDYPGVLVFLPSRTMKK
jgi:hypothetical protein